MKQKKLTIANIVILSLVVVINLFFLYHLKYSSHKLSLTDFRIEQIGNILNLSFSALIILGLVLNHIKKNSIQFGFVLVLVVILYLSLILAVLINLLDIPTKEYYLLSLSFTQVLIITAFSIFQFTQIYLMLFLWQKIFKKDRLLYFRTFVNSVFVLAGLFFFALVFINIKPSTKYLPRIIVGKKSVGVVLGAAVWSDNKPSPSLANRVDKAAELYKQKQISKIQLTGGNAPGELSEAEVSLNYILKKDVKKSDVWIEKKTTSTIEQVRFIKNNISGSKDLNSIVIISDMYHIKRVKEICRFYNIEVVMAPTSLNLKTVNIIFYQLRECIAILLFWLFAL
ncbi:MAG: YdcF family protein [Ignavibacteriaceae bacterium]|nr:YdcF family protein [Ignavibacteriaceae bacterium]